MKSKTEISGGTVFVLVVIMGVIFGGIAMATNSSSSRSTSTAGSISSTTYNSTPKIPITKIVIEGRIITILASNCSYA